MAEGLFRKAAIDKVSSPEQLDLLMRVTSPIGWLAVLTIAFMLSAVGVWSVVGTIPDLVDGQGTLFRGERLYDVKATMGGSIIALGVKTGADVMVGQTVATIKREKPEGPDVEQQQIQAAQEKIRALNDSLIADRGNAEKDRSAVVRLSGQLESLQKSYQLQKQLVDQGIRAANVLPPIDKEMDGIRSQIDSLNADVRQIEAKSKSTQAEVRATEAQIAAIRSGASTTAEVKSTESGKIVSVIKSQGDKIVEGDVLIRIERRGANESAEAQLCGGDVHALIYVPAASAGKVKKNQIVRVSPSDVQKEEYGFIFGKVESVATYSASTGDMTEKLKNDQLVKQFTSAGPVVEVRICLEKDPSHPANPFKWSSKQGPPQDTQAGTTATASIVVDEKKPYTYVVPAVRRATGL